MSETEEQLSKIILLRMKNAMELRLCHKLGYSNPNSFATQCLCLCHTLGYSNPNSFATQCLCLCHKLGYSNPNSFATQCLCLCHKLGYSNPNSFATQCLCLCHKLKPSNPNIFATWWYIHSYLKTICSKRCKSLKYLIRVWGKRSRYQSTPRFKVLKLSRKIWWEFCQLLLKYQS